MNLRVQAWWSLFFLSKSKQEETKRNLIGDQRTEAGHDLMRVYTTKFDSQQ